MKKKPRVVPPWDDYFMALAFFVASRSKDPDTQHGAILVHENTHMPVGWGYNGPPKAMIDTEIDWSRPAKYPFIVHAEMNAIDNEFNRAEFGETVLYVTGPPCSKCMIQLAKKKIKKVIYGPQSSNMVDEKDWRDSREIAARSRLTVERFQGNLNWMRDRLKWMVENQSEVFQPIVNVPL